MGMKGKLTGKPSKEHKGCTVLILSCDGNFLEYYRKLFLELGFAPVTANTPDLALGVLHQTVVAFIVVDQSARPSKTRRIMECARRTQRHAPILAIARRPEPQFRHEELSLGAVDYLDHPARSDDIAYALLRSETRAPKSRLARI